MQGEQKSYEKYSMRNFLMDCRVKPGNDGDESEGR